MTPFVDLSLEAATILNLLFIIFMYIFVLDVSTHLYISKQL